MKTEKWHYGHSESRTYVTHGGLTVAKSHSLRGLLEYGRKFAPVKIETRKAPDLPVCGELRVTYVNGAEGFAFFRSHGIMIDWLRNRRSWRHIATIHHDGDFGYLTKPGQIAGV